LIIASIAAMEKACLARRQEGEKGVEPVLHACMAGKIKGIVAILVEKGS